MVTMETGQIVELVVVVVIILMTMLTNSLTLFVLAWTESLRNINRVYMFSMTIADLCLGVFIMPFGIYNVVIAQFGDPGVDERLCRLQAYTTVMFFLAGLYSLSWMNIDHYVAIRKPERYKVMMSPPRSLCWIIFAWIAAVSFCCPPLLSFQKTFKYYVEVHLCTVYIGSETPYFITAGFLALLPALMSLLITNIYLFTWGFRKKQKMYEAVVLDVSSRPKNYHINFTISLVYFCTWVPWCLVRVISFFVLSIPPQIHFYTFWLAMGNTFYKFYLYLGMSVEYRRGLKAVFQRCCHCQCFERVANRRRRNLNLQYVATRVMSKATPETSAPPATAV